MCVIKRICCTRSLKKRHKASFPETERYALMFALVPRFSLALLVFFLGKWEKNLFFVPLSHLFESQNHKLFPREIILAKSILPVIESIFPV